MLALALASALSLQQDPPTLQLPDSPALFARAESLLETGRLPEARRLAEQLLRRSRDDTRALILLGRIHLDWPVVGRFRAESLLARASALAPRDPEPSYWLGRVGLALGGDDGEAIARRGLLHSLALDPRYRDAWQLWLTLYRGEGERRQMLEALRPHAGDYTVDLRRARLLLEDGAREAAEPLLHALSRRRPLDPEPLALLARLQFERGADDEAAASYESALRLAARDSGEVLWRQVRSIASPGEKRSWAGTPPELREGFLRLFWARRIPDLRSRANGRIGEHFRRMAQAQRYYALLHPSSMYHRSSLYRRRVGQGMPIPPDRGLEAPVVEAYNAPCDARLLGVRDDRFAAGFTDLVDEPGSQHTVNLEDGLDDRGRVFVRHGSPDRRFVFGQDAETWCYLRPEGALRVTFLRLSGDLVVRPVREGEAESASRLLATDRPSLVAELRFAFWPAAFRAAPDGSLTELLIFPDSVAAVAVLVDPEGREVARDSGARPLRLTAPPGRYALLLDADRDGRFGSYRGNIAVPDYPPDRLGVSGLLVAAGFTSPEREALETAAPGGLRLPAEQPMRLYAELYGLTGDGDVVRYEARYVFEREGGGFLGLGRGQRATTFGFERTQRIGPRMVETLVVDPGRLPRGRYRLRLEITDRVRGVRAASSTLRFELR